ncbi:MAG TPA: glycosyltransferase family 39 protein [Pseudonocardiaceae bacterium]|nr:glycosyltransferase family 39 protein [Pseudonocardiaceae bacterium]
MTDSGFGAGTVGDVPTDRATRIGRVTDTRARGGVRDVPDLAVRPVLGVAVAVTAVLLAVAGRYGYHRDELYFLSAGRRPAWGYPDQPPLVPLLAHVLGDVAPGSLVVLRTPSALAAGAVVVLAALTGRELGARAAAQVLAAVAMGSSAVLFGIGHLLSTATFALLADVLVLWLAVRATRTGRRRAWLPIGAVAGVGLLASGLVAFVMVAVVVGLLVSGPRDVFRSPWPWAGTVVAAAMWAPYLAWQAGHGWPELAVSRSIAAGGSASSVSRALLVPELFGLVGPWLAPIWVVGLVRLVRDPAVRRARWVAVAYVVVVVVFVATGGKSYYLAGFYPVLLGAGAQPVVDWIGHRRHRRYLLGGAVAISALSSVAVTLPVFPVAVFAGTPLNAVNPDSGETVGWPRYVAEIAAAYHRLPAAERDHTVILTSDYGEAGALEQFGHLPPVFSVHNGFWYWGPPPERATQVVAVGFDRSRLDAFCSHAVLLARLDNPWGLANRERGAPVWSCTRLPGSWASVWPAIKVIG